VGLGRWLEWATSCPPPRQNFQSLPRIRSVFPAFDLHHPEIVAIGIGGPASLGADPSPSEGTGGPFSSSGHSD
jgi:cytochrome c oxidase subunit I